MRRQLFGALICGLLLSACKSTSPTPPQWYLTPVQDKQVIASVGEGWSLAQAKKNALNGINQQLWTQISSSSQSRNIVNNLNGDEHYQQLNDNNIKANTAQLVLNDVNFSHTEKVGDHYYVQALANKSVITQQLQSELDQLNSQAQYQLNALANQDPLIWWLSNQQISSLEAKQHTYRSILAAMGGNSSSASSKGIQELKAQRDSVHRKLAIAVVTPKNEQWIHQFVGHSLSQQGISLAQNRGKNSHQLVVDTHWSQKKVADIYIATAKINLVLKDKVGRVLASNELIANANSVSNYALAKEGAARNFSAKLAEQSLWKTLGLF